MISKTTVGMTTELKSLLDEKKLCPTETYDHLIRRLVQEGFFESSNNDYRGAFDVAIRFIKKNGLYDKYKTLGVYRRTTE